MQWVSGVLQGRFEGRCWDLDPIYLRSWDIFGGAKEIGVSIFERGLFILGFWLVTMAGGGREDHERKRYVERI